MQALITAYVAPTHTKPTRIKVTTASGSKFYTWDHEFDATKNHINAALQHAKAMGWVKAGDKINYGGVPNSAGYAFTIITDYSQITVG